MNMRELWQSGCSGYAPEYNGLNLEVETCDHEVSYRNLKRMLQAGRKASRIEVSPHNTILVSFEDGEPYLACGLGVGCDDDPACQLLALFAGEAFPDYSLKAWQRTIFGFDTTDGGLRDVVPAMSYESEDIYEAGEE